ncbi:NUDIX domain-containing protein [uncultured Clostridium sp.]|uniref:NUDIX hydrolase n=1 Tax=uncultured Clostridium sp. TaxID=59620 RepID=UPI0025D0A689|nr:NUDIX domain-containing protein [uncultured Clostridium sp.]
MKVNIKDKDGLTEEEFIKTYNPARYERPSVTNDIIIFTTEDKEEENIRKVPRKGMQVLLIKRKEHPFIEKWAIPGGFVRMNESLQEGAERELKEETGIDKVYFEQLYTFGEINRDPRTRVISVGNVALISKNSVKPIAGDDAKEVQWFWINKKLISTENFTTDIKKRYLLSLVSEDDEIKINYEVTEILEKNIFRQKKVSYKFLNSSNDELAFDHYKILDYAIDRIRNKIQYTPIAVNLLPKLFTVKELQYVYEAIMGKELLNFRRKIGNMIVETDEKLEGKPYRPAQVYKFNENWEYEF